jgi:hypothetical protein
MASTSRAVIYLSYGHGLFYLLTGLWPLVARRSFQWVTGPKTDFWLAQTVGALIAVTGFTLLAAARRRYISDDLALIAAGQALALAMVDLIMAGRGEIAATYLIDAPIELALGVAWVLFYFTTQPDKKIHPPEPHP